MHSPKEKTNATQNRLTASIVKKQDNKAPASVLVDNRPEALQARELQQLADNSPQARQAVQLQGMADDYAVRQQLPLRETDMMPPGASQEDKTKRPQNLIDGAMAHLGVGINDDPALEKEADVMGQKELQGAAGHDIGQMKQRSTQEKNGINVKGSIGVVQRAGHEEDLCFLDNKEWIVKRIDETEKKEYSRFRRFYLYVDSERMPVPRVLGPFSSLENLQNEDIELSEKDLIKLRAMTLTRGKWLVAMKNVTGGSPDAIELIDLKLGSYTADEADQARHGSNWWERKFKLFRHGIMDKNSPSRSHGFRDEDAWKTTPKSRWLFSKRSTNINTNLNQFKSKLEKGGTEALMNLLPSLDIITEFIKDADKVYVGSSILIVLNNANPEMSVSKLIDFEHPLLFPDPGYVSFKQGLLSGIGNIVNLINEIIKKRDEDIRWNRIFESLDTPEQYEIEVALASLPFPTHPHHLDLG